MNSNADWTIRNLVCTGYITAQLPPDIIDQMPPIFGFDDTTSTNDMLLSFANEIVRLGNQMIGSYVGTSSIDGLPVVQTVNDIIFTLYTGGGASSYNAGLTRAYGTVVYNVIDAAGRTFISNYLVKRAGVRLTLSVTSPSDVTTTTTYDIGTYNASAVGSTTGTAGTLSVTSDTDPFPTSSTLTTLYRAIKMSIVPTTPLISGSAPRYVVGFTVTDGTSVRVSVPMSLYIDALPTPQVLSAYISADTNSSGTWVYISGVPRLPVGATLGFTCQIRHFVTEYYHLIKTWQVSGTPITTSSYLATSPELLAAVTAPTSYMTQSNTFTLAADSYVASLSGAITYTVYNSKGDTITSAVTCNFARQGDSATVTSMSVDTRSIGIGESTRRVKSGLGLYPADGTFGTTYDSSISLVSNEEMQMIGGIITYPSINYSTTSPQGPDYSVAGISVTTNASMRYITAKFIPDTYMSRINILISNVTGDIIAAMLDDLSIVVNVKLDTSVWYSATSPFEPQEATANGKGIAEFGINAPTVTSGVLTIPVTFGQTISCTNLYIRVGCLVSNTVTFGEITYTITSS
jgi:hypothetical protein